MLDDDVRQTHPIKDNLGRTQHIKASTAYHRRGNSLISEIPVAVPED
ncbi:hypothetical protein [Bacteroides stercoris]|nr:hypothetical protein [Bacteroides stercoris]